MTATASPKEEVRSTAGRFSFQTCGCANPKAHGYFHLPDGMKGGAPYFSKVVTLEALKLYVERGEIPADQQTIIEEDINLSNLAELEDHQGEGDHDNVSNTLVNLLVELLITSDQEKACPDGTFFFEVVDGLGYINNITGVFESPSASTKSQALELLAIGVNIDVIGSADETMIKKQIAESGLPD